LRNAAQYQKGIMAEQLKKTKSRNGQESAPKTIDAWCIAELLLERWPWLAVSACLLAILGLAAGLLGWTKTWTATAQLMRYEPMATGDFFKPAPMSQDTFTSLLKSPELLQQVSTNVQPNVSTDMLAKIVIIASDPDSDIVKVSVKGISPQWTVDVANLYANEAVAFTRERQKREAEEVNRTLLQQRLLQMDKDVGALEKEFRALPQSGALSAKLATVTNINQQIQNSRSPMVTARLTEKLTIALDELSALTRKYTDEHPLVQRQKEVVESLEHDLGSATNSVAGSFPPGMARDGTPAGQLFNPDYEIIRGRLQALATSRQVLFDRQQEAMAFAANPPGNVRFFTPATVKGIKPDHYWIRAGLLTIFGGIFGMLCAGGVVMLVEFVDSRLKTAADVQRVTGLPVIATLTDLEDKAPSARELWAFRTWTMLQGRLSPSPNHGLVCGITSSRAGEGRSTWINLLADAASLSGFRVLTIATRHPNGDGPAPQIENSHASNGNGHAANGHANSHAANGQTNGHSNTTPEVEGENALTVNALACPAEVTQQLTGPNARPSVHIPLPGWVWNLERRKQWQEALAHWRSVDNLVILVELPPAYIPEAVLLGENLPNLVWLTGSGQAEAAETRMQLETLRHARCNLVGAVLNREPALPLKSRFPRWLGCLAIGFGLMLPVARAQDTNLPPATNSEAALTTNLSFSITEPSQRSEWQKRLTLGSGDVLNIGIYGQSDSLRPDVLIGPDGRFSYLEAQNVLATGLTIDELRTNLDQELGKYRRVPRTIITPVAYRSKRYYMLGKVAQRGSYVLDRPLTVVEAVARAHGLETGVSGRNSLELADFQKSFLMRGGKRIPLDFEKLFLHGDLSQNIAIEPDDYLYFPPASIQQVYVLGEVRVPGVVPYTREMTVIGALSARGGFTDAAYKTHVMVLRGSFNHPKLYVVDTLTVLDARGQDFKLEPRDVIYVSGRPFLRGEELLDLALSAFLQSMTAEWAGRHVGPILGRDVIP
jgi:protein involved in polysaccharide export with SLBB domain/capsular polysaccharide biosynthesis protein